MIVPKNDALKDLSLARKLLLSSCGTDIHVSPYEVIFNSFRYSPNSLDEGVFSIDDSRYQTPLVGPLRVDSDPTRPLTDQERLKSSALSIFLYRKVYSHIGPKVISDQMELSGISRCLLLPVVQPDSNGQEEMAFVHQIYGSEDSFLLGYCVPLVVPIPELGTQIQAAIERYDIRALKIHPNITGINPSSASGLKRIETILEICNTVQLPLVVHGGRSPVIKDPRAAEYASLTNLARIDWGITKTPVMISHAGMMGRSPDEIENIEWPHFEKILQTYDNIMVDISALDLSALRIILERIDTGRILFGSDCLYFSQWGGIVKLMQALRLASFPLDEAFLRIVSRNASRFLSSGEKVSC